MTGSRRTVASPEASGWSTIPRTGIYGAGSYRARERFPPRSTAFHVPSRHGDHIYKVYETAAYIIPEGRAILRYQERVIESMVRPGKVAIVRIGGYAVPCINITDPFLISEVVGQLAEKYPKHMFAAGYFITANGEVCYSLRSRHGCDVSIVAGKLGGGGHPRAAGFRIDHVIRAI